MVLLNKKKSELFKLLDRGDIFISFNERMNEVSYIENLPRKDEKGTTAKAGKKANEQNHKESESQSLSAREAENRKRDPVAEGHEE